jgi:threonine/homoserine/homoserine lactone efflux protein
LNASYLLKGIMLGLLLTIMVGPILFALIQAGIERGFRAGAMIGLGIWISDLIFILFAYFGISYLLNILEWDGFELTLGIAGGFVLIVTGILTILSKPPEIGNSSGVSGSYLALWLKGFLINTVNPFTVFFWATVMTTIVAKDNLNGQNAAFFFGGILGTVIITDSLKVLLAKAIRKWLKPKHILWTRRVSGFALVIFGIVLMVRVVI